MRVGYMLHMQNLRDDVSDAQMVRDEMRLAERAEDCGFDAIWCPEHHFESYSMAVDNLQILTWIGARTKTIQLGSAALILPWWTQPIRLVERIAMLDAMSGGRYIIGFGRGLARREFEAFGVSPEESRGRFDEMSKMIFKALETGFIEGEGPFFPQIRTEIRPRPASFKNRLYSVAMSPESAKAIASLDTRMMTFVQFSMEKLLPNIEIYQREYQKNHGGTAPPTLLVDDSYCDRDPAKAEAVVRKYLAAKYVSILQHYEFMADYHKELKGYEAYGESAKFLNAIGLEGAVDDYISHQAWGTPQQILDKLDKRRAVIGNFEWITTLSQGGMPVELAHGSMELMGKEVLPELKTWSPVRKDQPVANCPTAA